jgi:hypothetical protein
MGFRNRCIIRIKCIKCIEVYFRCILPKQRCLGKKRVNKVTRVIGG